MDYMKLSKQVSYVLRHHPEQYNIELDRNGFVKISILLNELNSRKEYDRELTKDDLVYIINNSDKVRFQIVDEKIRAFYGHSITNIKIEYPECTPPEVLYHGTTHKAVSKIFESGLLPMNRQYVHLSEDVETATAVGKRRDDNPVILAVESKKAWDDGVKFYAGLNKIWLCDNIDSKYLKIKEN